MIYKKRLRRLNFSLLSTNTKWMVFGITSSCSKRRSQCCSPLLCCNTTWSKEAIVAAAEMRSPDGPSRSPSTYAILPIAISFWSLLVYHIVRTTSGIAISTYLVTRRLPPTPPFCLLLSSSFFLLLQGHSTYYWVRRALLTSVSGNYAFSFVIDFWCYLVTKKSFGRGNENRKYFISHVSCSGQQII